MKRAWLFIAVALIVLTTLTAKAQTTPRITLATSLGTGIPVSTPAYVPFTWQVTGHYNIGERFSVGIGTGLSIYEEILVPVFADAKFRITKPRKFTPYLGCSGGYGFALSKNGGSGLYLNPYLGVEYSVWRNNKLFFSLGYQLQGLERLKHQEHPLFNSEFTEKLNHSSVSVKIGYKF